MAENRKKLAIVFCRLIAIVFIGVFIILTFIEKQMIYPGTKLRKTFGYPAIKKDSNLESWTKNISDNEFVEAFFVPSTSPISKGTVLFAHGNAELIDDWTDSLSFYYQQLDYNLLLVEYRGYGRSGGSPHQKEIIEDFSFFYDKLLQEKGPQEKFVFHGRSLGGGVIADLTKHRKATHLILESTFTRLTDIAFQMFYVPSFFISNKYPTIDTLSDFEKPLLVIHGTEDQLVPIDHGKKLFDAAKEKKMFFSMKSGHNDPPPEKEKYWQAISDFLEN